MTAQEKPKEKFWPAVLKFTCKHANLFISGGLVIASSGLDGVYMSLWTPTFPILGFILNFAADVTNMYLGNQVGKLLRSKSSTKHAGAVFLFTGEIVAIAYSWLFSWRQLLIVLPAVEPADYRWLSLVIGGFIPSLLAYLGVSNGLNSVSGKLFAAQHPDYDLTPEQIADILDAISKKDEQQLPVLNQSFATEGLLPTKIDSGLAIDSSADDSLGLSPAARRTQLVGIWSGNPHATQQQLAERFSVSRATIGNDYRHLSRIGRVKRNGHGVEVLIHG